MQNVNVYEMADAREKRRKNQRALIKKYNCPLISFTLNIPGPEKDSLIFRKIHEEGIIRIKEIFKKDLISFESKSIFTGSESYFSISQLEVEIKKKTIKIEEDHILGRIFDLDVIGLNYESISRKELGYRQRKCLICNNYAFICSRNRTHSVDLLIDKIYELSNYLIVN